MYTKMNAQQATRARRGYAAAGAVGVAESPSVAAGCGAGNGVRAAQGVAAVDLSVAMKECPVCKARCFADMSVCYNCLHSFGSSEDQVATQADRLVFDASGCGEDPNGLVPAWHEEDVFAVEGYDLELPEEDACVSLREEGSAATAPIVEAAAIPAGKPFGITVNVPEGLVASYERIEPMQMRPDQLMEVIISIKVAQDACSKRAAVSAE